MSEIKTESISFTSLMYRTVTRMETQMQVIFLVWMPKQVWGLLQMFALNAKYAIMCK